MMWGSIDDEWFAWRPVRLGALGTGRWVWLRRVWRNRSIGVTIYQDLADIEEWTKRGDLMGIVGPYLEPCDPAPHGGEAEPPA